MVLLLVLAKLCGEDRPYGIAQWLEGRASRLIPTPGWGLPANDFQQALTYNKGHGRLEERILTSSELLNGCLDWPHVAQVFRLERRRTYLRTGIQETEVVCGLTLMADFGKALGARRANLTRMRRRI